MKSCMINVYKCIVNISSQDFGIYRNWKAKFGVGSKAEQHGVGEALVVKPEDGVMESESGVDGVGWWFWALAILTKMCWWLVGLRSLLGWLWWWWEVAWAGNQDFIRRDAIQLRHRERWSTQTLCADWMRFGMLSPQPSHPTSPRWYKKNAERRKVPSLQEVMHAEWLRFELMYKGLRN